MAETGKTPGPRIVIASRVSYMRVARTRFFEGGSSQEFATLDLSYDLQALMPLSVLLKGMYEANQKPIVYIWNEHTGFAEIVVYFQLTAPSAEVLRQLTPYIGAAVRASNSIVASGEAVIEARATKVLRENLARDRKFYVLVTEVGTDDKDLNPLAQFGLTRILDGPPSLAD